MAGPALPEPLGALRRALVESGAIGATSRQLASRLAHPALEVACALDRLAAEGEVIRMGRGLYVLRDFEALEEGDGFEGPDAYAERFVHEDGVAIGRYAGPITFADNDVLPVHRWWPYVQGYSATFVRTQLERARLECSGTVLDPFAGSGTTLVEARLSGHRALGSELLAPACLASRVKTHFELDPGTLRRAYRRWVARARRAGRSAPPFLRETRRQFDPRSLEALLRLRSTLPSGGEPTRDALRLAFGRTLIPASRLHRSPCLGYGRRTASAEPLAELERTLETFVEDLDWLRTRAREWGRPAEVRAGDARDVRWPSGSVDLAVTSPPYVNGMDYVMNYKLDLAWLGFAHSYDDLAALRRSLVSCDNLPRAEAARYAALERSPDPWLPEILDRIRTNVERKGSYRRHDVHGIVLRYFLDLVPVLRNVHEALRPGGRFVLVVGDSLIAGTYIPGDLLLARMGAEVGFRLVSVEQARVRRSGQRRSFRLRESVITLERPGAAS